MKLPRCLITGFLIFVFLCISVSALTPFDYVITATGTQNSEDTSVIRSFTWTVNGAGTETTVSPGQGTGGALYQARADGNLLGAAFEGYFMQTISQQLQGGDKVYLSYAFNLTSFGSGCYSGPASANWLEEVILVKPDGQEVILDSYAMNPGTTTPWMYIKDKDVSQFFDQTGTYKIKMYQKASSGSCWQPGNLAIVDEIRLNVVRGTIPLGNVISNSDLATGMTNWNFVQISGGHCLVNSNTGEQICPYGWYSTSGYRGSIGSSYAVTNSDSGAAQISASEGEKTINSFSAIPQSQHGGVVSDIIYTVTSNNPDVEVFFSDTRTQTTSDPNANIIAETTPGVKLVSWSDTEQGSSSVSVSDGDKLITSSTLIAPNHDTQWSVVDTSASVETWMIGEKLYAKVGLVDSCHVQLLTKIGPDAVCPTCDYYEYTITASASEDVASLRVEDTLPNSLSYISSSPYAPSTIVGQKLTWYFSDPGTSSQKITIKVKPLITTNPVSNFVSAEVLPYGWEDWTEDWTGGTDTSLNPTITQFDAKECSLPSPEFPSIILPVGIIIGLLGAVLLIQRTREY